MRLRWLILVLVLPLLSIACAELTPEPDGVEEGALAGSYDVALVSTDWSFERLGDEGCERVEEVVRFTGSTQTVAHHADENG